MKNSTSWWARNFTVNPLVIAAILMTAIACSNHNKSETTDGPFVVSDTMMRQLEFAEAHIETVKSQLPLVGKIIADENKLVEIFPLVGGYVKDVSVELGDYVQKGQVLSIIRSGEVADFERQMIDAKNDLIVSQNGLRVAQELYSSKLVSEKEVLAARNEVIKNQAEIERLEQVFSIYGIDNKAEYSVKAPISGFVIDKKITRDMQLRSDKSDNIFTIAEISDVWVSANVYETDISKIRPGMNAEIKTLSYPDTLFLGKVDKIYNFLDPQTRTMKVRIRLPNAKYLLKPEMNASITLKYEEGYQNLAVPSNALIFDKNKSFVIVFHSANNLETREVEVNKQTGETTYLRGGLVPGEKVVSKNQLMLYNALNN